MDIKYNLLQANSFKIEELLSKGTMLANAMIIENSKDTEELIIYLKTIIQKTKNREKLNKLRNIVKYILKGILEKEDIEKIEEMIEEKEENYSMDELIERIKRNDRKRMEKIEQQAIKQGMEKTARKIVKNLKSLNMPLEQIMQVTGLTEERIKSIR